MDAKLCFFVAVTPLAENFELFNFTWITKVVFFFLWLTLLVFEIVLTLEKDGSSLCCL